MVFANIEYLFLAIIAYTLYCMVYLEAKENLKLPFRFRMHGYMRILLKVIRIICYMLHLYCASLHWL